MFHYSAILPELQVISLFSQTFQKRRLLRLVFGVQFMYNNSNVLVYYFTKEACIMKNTKLVISIGAAVIVLAAAVCAVIVFQEEITKFYRSCCDYCRKLVGGKKDEYADFVD